MLRCFGLCGLALGLQLLLLLRCFLERLKDLLPRPMHMHHAFSKHHERVCNTDNTRSMGDQYNASPFRLGLLNSSNQRMLTCVVKI